MANATGILSKGIVLKLGELELPNLQEVPEIGGSVEKVEITTLADGAKRYINGIKDYGDLSFKFLYDTDDTASSFKALKSAEDAGTVGSFVVEFPDGTSVSFEAGVNVRMDSASVNSPLTFTADLSLNSEMTWTVATPLNARMATAQNPTYAKSHR